MRRSMLFILLLWVASCSDLKEQSIKKSVEMIDFSNVENEYKEVFLSDYVDSIKYVKLEENDSAFLSKRLLITANENHIFVLDKAFSQAYLFSSTGKFLRRIGHKGEAPFEYQYPTSILITKDGMNFVILDNATRRVLFYDSSGNLDHYFTNKSNLAYRIFQTADSNLMLVAPSAGKKYDVSPEFLFVDKKGTVLDSINITDKYDYNILPNPAFSLQNNSISYWQKHKDTLFSIDSNNKLVPIVYFFSKNLMPKDKQATAEDKFLKDYTIFDYVHDYSRFYIVEGIENGKTPLAFFYDKQIKKPFNVLYKSEFALHGFVNDIDGGVPFWPNGQISSRISYSIINSGIFKKLYKEALDKKIKYKSETQHAFLDNFMGSLTESENIILMKAYFRK